MDNTCKNCKHHDMPITSGICLECLHFPAVCALWEQKSITNAERIRSMSDEELADFLYKYMDCTDCPIECDPGKDICLYKIMEWLKKESE